MQSFCSAEQGHDMVFAWHQYDHSLVPPSQHWFSHCELQGQSFGEAAQDRFEPIHSPVDEKVLP
jgi:hypothetical protein